MSCWAVLLLGCRAHAHEHVGNAPPAAQLGAVAFETSCNAQAMPDFNRGAALLHSFWHDEAGRAFEKAASVDPDCAMAYWGAALASFHLYSDTPTAADLATVKQALAHADAAREKNARESDYIRALHRLYDGYRPSQHVIYAKRFADAMGALAARYPGDIEAKAFYALGLLSSDRPGDVTLSNARQAVAILYPIYREHPDHPGLAHYLIHACDHPAMAEQGLEAARRYASIAPAAPHALHMPSHIFARLGLWQDDIRSNLASKVAAEDTSGAHIGAENRLHAMEFLEYAYLQTGQYEEARTIVGEARTVPSADVRYPDYYGTVQARFSMLLAVETRDWALAATLEPVDGAHWFSHALTLLAHAIAAGHQRDAQAGKTAAETFDRLMAPVPALPIGSSGANLRDEIYAWAAFARGDSESALRLLRPIAERQRTVGKGEVELPAGEMLAEVLVLAGQPLEALSEYERALRTDPNRFNGLLGASRAAEQLGRHELAAQYLRRLAANCPGANGGAQTVLADALRPD
jgi:tetratricopeptide (TPR) repeat protein